MFGKLFGGGEKYSLLKLSKGYTFDYQKVTWEIMEVYEYDWGRDGMSTEYKIEGDGQVAFLEVEDDDGDIVCLFSVEVEKHELAPDFGPEDFEGEEILSELDYTDRRYALEDIYEGHYKNTTGMERSQKVTTYNFKDENHFVCIAQWADGSMDYSVGQEIEGDKIKKIKPPHIL